MGSFTTITGSTNLQSLTILNEIQLAYSERRLVLGQSAEALLTAESNTQTHDYWETLQSWLEANCTSYVNPNGSSSSVRPKALHSVSSWRAAAGLPAGGFRRATTKPADWTSNTDPAYSFGVAQAGDIRGPWLWVDLQRGLSALRYTDAAAGVADEEEIVSPSSLTGTCAAVRQDVIDTWPASWTSSTWTHYYVSAQISGSGSACAGTAMRASVIRAVSGLSTTVPCVPAVWCRFSALFGAFHDFDGMGVSDGDWRLCETLSQAQTSSRTGSRIGDYADCPISASFPPCPDQEGGGIEYDIYSSATRWLLDWQFTHS